MIKFVIEILLLIKQPSLFLKMDMNGVFNFEELWTVRTKIKICFEFFFFELQS